jgi:MraZ protein
VLLGEHAHTIDEKSRLTLPAKFRKAFATGVVLTRGMDGCVYVYSSEDWRRFVAGRLDELDPLSKEARQLARFLYSAATETEVDRQGRVMLPPALKTHAKLERDVVVAGVRDHVEIWDRAAWYEQLEEVEGGAELVAERLAQKRD